MTEETSDEGKTPMKQLFPGEKNKIISGLLTRREEEYLQKLFADYHKKIESELNQELQILSKYKGELARHYESAAKYHNTLIGCMKDIIDKQEELNGLCRQLGEMAARIESYFLQEPQEIAQDDAAHSCDEQAAFTETAPVYESDIDKNILIDALFQDVGVSFVRGVLVDYLIRGKTVSVTHIDLAREALPSNGITHLYMLDGKSVAQIIDIPGVGPECAALIIFLAELEGLKIVYGEIADHISTHYFLNKLKGNDCTKIGELEQ